MKAALVTGGAVRLGRRIVERLAAAGYAIGLHHRTSTAEAEALAAQLAVPVVLLPADLADPDEVRGMCETAVARLGGLDLLVNSASIFHPTRQLADCLRDWDLFERVNLRAPLQASVACAEALAERQGSIVNIVDIHGLAPMPGYLPYSLSKAGLVALTHRLALELAPRVRVNGVAPGAILMPVDAAAEQTAALLKRVPAGRLGTPDDIAEAVLYLAQAPYVTGQILSVDGGRSLQR